MRVVSGDAPVEPDRSPNAKIAREKPLEPLAIETGIASLHGAKQAFLRGQQSARAVYIDTAAFQHNTGFPKGRTRPGNAIASVVVEPPIVVFRPTIENPFCGRDLALRVPNENRAEVASPTSIRRDVEELDCAHHRAGLRQRFRYVLHRFISDQDAHFFDARKMADDVRV